jgi:hypothetical protein
MTWTQVNWRRSQIDNVRVQPKFVSKQTKKQSVIGEQHEILDSITCRFDSSTLYDIWNVLECGQVATPSPAHIEVPLHMDLVQRKSNFSLALSNLKLLGGIDEPSNLECISILWFWKLLNNSDSPQSGMISHYFEPFVLDIDWIKPNITRGNEFTITWMI